MCSAPLVSNRTVSTAQRTTARQATLCGSGPCSSMPGSLADARPSRRSGRTADNKPVGLFFIALATVGCSFGFAAFVFLHMADRETAAPTPPAEAGNDTMKRVIGDIERLA